MIGLFAFQKLSSVSTSVYATFMFSPGVYPRGGLAAGSHMSWQG